MDPNDTFTNSTTLIMTNNNIATTTNPMVDFANKFRFYSIIILIVIGLVCNFLAFLVFLRPSLRKSTSSCYLLALSIADTAVLVAEGKLEFCSILILLGLFMVKLSF